MKKLFVGILAAICCCAFMAPAFAEVKVEGMIQTDAYWYNMSKEMAQVNASAAANRSPGNTTTQRGFIKDGRTYTAEDWNTTRINMPQPTNRISVRYTGEDKVVNGFIQIRAGGSRANALAEGGPLNYGVSSESALSWEYAQIDWHVNPNLFFRFGRQDATFANAYAAWQGLGQTDLHIIGLNYGNVTAQTRDAIRAFIKFNDNVRMEIQLLDPNTEGATAGLVGTEFTLRTSRTGGAAALEANVMPRFDISLPIKVANFTIEPGFTYLKQEYDQVLAGDDDGYTIWGLTLGASAAWGPFSLMGEFTYGENLGPNSSHWGANPGSPVLWTNSAGNILIESGESTCWFIQAQFDFGPFAIQGIYGMGQYKNDGSPTARDASEYDITMRMYGLNFPIKVTKTFTITPSIYYYDNDDGAFIGSISTAANIDRGSEMIIGAAFNLVF